MAPNAPQPRPTFDGFPYLLVRIGHTPLRHIEPLPAGWPRERLLDVARRQRDANRLDACLCLSMADGVYVFPDGREATGPLQVWGIPLTGMLKLPDPVPETSELRARRAALAGFIRVHGTMDGVLVGDGLEGGRRATTDDVRRLSGRGSDGVPVGLTPCRVCGAYRGNYLALEGEGNGDRTPRVLEVHCRCENHNRCARCGGPLAEGRLSAYEYDPDGGRILYRAAYSGLGHRCGE